MDGMALAQVAHDSAEPPHETKCWFCDGQGDVYASAVRNVNGEDFPFRHPANAAVEVPCPVCKLGMTVNGDRLE